MITYTQFALSTYKVYLAKPLEDKDDVHAKATSYETRTM